MLTFETSAMSAGYLAERLSTPAGDVLTISIPDPDPTLAHCWEVWRVLDDPEGEEGYYPVIVGYADTPEDCELAARIEGRGEYWVAEQRAPRRVGRPICIGEEIGV